MSKLSKLIAVAGMLAVGGGATAGYGAEYRQIAQAEPPASAPASAPARPRPPAPRHVEKPKAAPVAAPAPAAVPAQAANTALVSQKLTEAGAACTGRIEDIARDALGGTKGLVPVSSWLPRDPKKHMASVIVGQDFGPEARVPHGLTGIVAAPTGQGDQCDGYTFQVMPSPLTCGEIQANFLKSGQPVADLAGFPLLRNARSQVALMPAVSGPGCIVVSVSLSY